MDRCLVWDMSKNTCLGTSLDLIPLLNNTLTNTAFGISVSFTWEHSWLKAWAYVEPISMTLWWQNFHLKCSCEFLQIFSLKSSSPCSGPCLSTKCSMGLGNYNLSFLDEFNLNCDPWDVLEGVSCKYDSDRHWWWWWTMP